MQEKAQIVLASCYTYSVSENTNSRSLFFTQIYTSYPDEENDSCERKAPGRNVFEYQWLIADSIYTLLEKESPEEKGGVMQLPIVSEYEE